MTETRAASGIDTSRVRVRPARVQDATALNDLYNHYILNTPITFHTEAWTLAQRIEWMAEFSETGPYRLLVADLNGVVLGFACSHRFHDRPAYATTVETSIYCRHDVTGRGIGRLLYGALFDALKSEPVHLAVAGVTLPNDASVGIHRRFGFEPVGVYHAVGRKFGRYWDVAWFEKLLD